MYTQKQVQNLLKKQRQLCADSIGEIGIGNTSDYELVYNAVLNAREPELGEKENIKLKQGGITTDDLLHDIAYDIGLENGWLKNNQWQTDELKEKAFSLAKKEAGKYAKGGETNIGWIITG